MGAAHCFHGERPETTCRDYRLSLSRGGRGAPRSQCVCGGRLASELRRCPHLHGGAFGPAGERRFPAAPRTDQPGRPGSLRAAVGRGEKGGAPPPRQPMAAGGSSPRCCGRGELANEGRARAAAAAAAVVTAARPLPALLRRGGRAARSTVVPPAGPCRAVPCGAGSGSGSSPRGAMSRGGAGPAVGTG